MCIIELLETLVKLFHTTCTTSITGNSCHPRMQFGNAFGHTCLSVCPVHALTFESVDLKTSVLVCGTSSEYSGHVICTWRSRSREHNVGRTSITKYVHLWVVYLWLKDNLVQSYQCTLQWTWSPWQQLYTDNQYILSEWGQSLTC